MASCRPPKQLLKIHAHLYKQLETSRLIHSSSRGYAAHLVREDQSEASLKSWKDIPGLKSYSSTETSIGIMRRKNFDLNKMHLFWKDAVREFGPIMKLSFPGQPSTVAIAHPEDIKTLHYEQSGDASPTIRSQALSPTDPLVPDGHEGMWRKRKGVQSVIMRKESISYFLSRTDEVVMEFLNRIWQLQEQHGEMPENFDEELQKFALEAIGIVALNQRLGCFNESETLPSDTQDLIDALKCALRVSPSCTGEDVLHMWKLIPKESHQNLQEVRDILLKILFLNMDKCNSGETSQRDSHSLVASLLAVPGVSTKDALAMIHDLFLAGIPSISKSLGFVLYLLAKNPEVQSRLQDEVDSVIGSDCEAVTEELINQMPYLRACIKESFRIFPPTFGALKILDNDVVLSNYHVPKGKPILSLNMIACWDESVFPRADEYIPERWLKSNPLGPIHPFASLPFSHGAKMCVGKRIAERELHTFLARVVQRFNVRYNYEDFDILTTTLSTPSLPLKFEFLKRHQ